MASGGVSAGGPRPELAGVEYCPDAGDPAACDFERIHRHSDTGRAMEASWRQAAGVPPVIFTQMKQLGLIQA